MTLYKRRKRHRGRVFRDRSPRGKKIALLRGAAVALLLVIAGFSGYRLIAYFSHSAQDLSKQAERAEAYEAAVRAEASETPAPEMLAALGTPESVPLLTDPVTTAPSVRPTADATAEPITIPSKFFSFSGPTRAAVRKLKEQNSDCVGWIEISGVVSQPIVYKNNTYYLTRDFDRKKNASGAIFLDEFSPLRDSTQKLLLHGHNMKDGGMFGLLSHYTDVKFTRSHAFATLDTLYERYTYAVFAVLRVSTDVKSAAYFDFMGNATFPSAYVFDRWLEDVKARSMYTCTVPVDARDAILSLSTCIGDDRLVIMLRRLRTGETESALKVKVNIMQSK